MTFKQNQNVTLFLSIRQTKDAGFVALVIAIAHSLSRAVKQERIMLRISILAITIHRTV